MRFSQVCFGLLLWILVTNRASAEVDPIDESAIAEVEQHIQEQVKQDGWGKYNPLTSKLCVGAAERMGARLLNACLNNPSSELENWNIRIIELKDCHDAILVTSGNTGRHYYVDSYYPSMFSTTGLLGLVEMKSIGDEVWQPRFILDKLQLRPITELCIFNRLDAFTQTFYTLDGPKSVGCQSSSGELLSPSSVDICPLPEPTEPFPVQIVGSIDPNDKFGSVGVGEQHHIAADEPLRYAIYFENLEVATAAAQDVSIVDPLDDPNFDLESLQLGAITFGDKIIVPPPGLQNFEDEIDLRPDVNLLVKIEVELDTVNRILNWNFSSIDPDTGQPTTDPLAGFLPPNVTPPEGDGSVSFTVMPKKGLLTGTEFFNDAQIIFDVNAPILTPLWANVLDSSVPSSKVLPLDAIQSNEAFTVEWAGTDEGSGIKHFTIFVSENSGPFEQWKVNTPDTSANFSGRGGSTYSISSGQ